MKIAAAALTLATLISLVPSYVSAEDGIGRKTIDKVVFSGKRTRLGEFWHIGGDCRTMSIPAYKVIEQPKHGRFEVVQEPVFPSEKSSRAHCSKIKARGLGTYYTSQKGYHGSDRVVVRTEVGDGVLGDKIVQIRVVN
jgi:hypothetical protein